MDAESSASRARQVAAGLRVGYWLPPALAVAALVLAWQVYAARHPYVLPRLSKIGSQLQARPELFARNALTTLEEALVGAACGMGAAFILAVLMFYVRVIERAIMPLAVVLNVTPLVAVAPALVVAFGFGMTPKYVIASLLVFFPFLVNALAGLRAVDPRALDVLTTLHASRAEVLWRLRLPSSLPYLFAAGRICMPLSLIGAVVAEFVAAGDAKGLGTLVVTASSLGDLGKVYAAVVVLALLGVAMFGFVVVLQRVVLGRFGPDDSAGA
ncbi:MAG TPA: ABC transporter permease subunit [Mycobacteriales bacterium]|jgi:NitT/TauT family transport system permease protein|nr:ABC transporter permease subunit [Mycobacteriales bacterium]